MSSSEGLALLSSTMDCCMSCSSKPHCAKACNQQQKRTQMIRWDALTKVPDCWHYSKRLTFLASELISVYSMNSGGACLGQTLLACAFVTCTLILFAALHPTEIFIQMLASLKLFLFSPRLAMCMVIRLILFLASLRLGMLSFCSKPFPDYVVISLFPRSFYC